MYDNYFSRPHCLLPYLRLHHKLYLLTFHLYPKPDHSPPLSHHKRGPKLPLSYSPRHSSSLRKVGTVRISYRHARLPTSAMGRHHVLGCPGSSRLVRGGELRLRTRWQLRTVPGRPSHPPDARPHAPATKKGDSRRTETLDSCPQTGPGGENRFIF